MNHMECSQPYYVMKKLVILVFFLEIDIDFYFILAEIFTG